MFSLDTILYYRHYRSTAFGTPRHFSFWLSRPEKKTLSIFLPSAVNRMEEMLVSLVSASPEASPRTPLTRGELSNKHLKLKSPIRVFGASQMQLSKHLQP